MIKTTNEIFENEFFAKGIQKLYQNDSISPKCAYKISNLFRKIAEKSVSFFEVKQSLLNTYGTEKEHGSWEIKPENINEFNSKLKELLEIEIEFNFSKVPWEENMNLSAIEIDALKDFIDFSFLDEE